jgi:hypothetical protein
MNYETTRSDPLEFAFKQTAIRKITYDKQAA